MVARRTTFSLVFGVSLLAAQTPVRDPGPGASAAPRKMALLIANSRYQSLPEPVGTAGAAALEQLLRELKFDAVNAVTNLSLKQMADAVNTFATSLRPNDVAFFYYSGYAMQSRQNFLVPVDFDPASARPAYEISYGLSALQQALERKQLSLKIIVLDAAWPLTARAGAPGLAVPDIPPLTLIAFSAARDQVTRERENGMGLFTGALLHVLRQPGMMIDNAFIEARQEVIKRSKSGQQPLIFPGGVRLVMIEPPKPVTPPAPKPVIIVKTEQPRPGTRGTNIDRLDYTYIPAGTFLMGCVPASQKDCEPHELPQHRVTISAPFWMGQTEVEVRAYRLFADQLKRRMPAAPGHNRNWQNLTLPIVRVSWQDASDYCKWAGGRLPTEAEWEYGARAGKDNQTFPYTDLKESREKANFYGREGNDLYEDRPAPVKSFDPNPWGLFDMAGNVWEWVSDEYDPKYYAVSPPRDPAGPPRGAATPGRAQETERVARGGSFDSDAGRHLRLSYRRAFKNESNHLGFRCVLPDTVEVRKQFNLPPPEPKP
jgi:formylglycine-generating enzyme required for sulfatase activity